MGQKTGLSLVAGLFYFTKPWGYHYLILVPLCLREYRQSLQEYILLLQQIITSFLGRHEGHIKPGKGAAGVQGSNNPLSF